MLSTQVRIASRCDRFARLASLALGHAISSDQAFSCLGKYCVTNLGQSGATMQKRPNGDAPWWVTPKYKQWTAPANAKLWDKVVIMLGTNDAKDACPAEGCPASAGCGNASFCAFDRPGSCCNWPHAGQTSWVQDCTDGVSCPFAKDYGAMIAVARTLGKQPAGPELWLAIPPPLYASFYFLAF